MNQDQLIEPVVDAVSQLLDQRIGLRSEPSARSRLRRCVRDDIVSRGQSPERYLDTLRRDEAVRQRLFDRITVQESSFFRHPEHFDVLAQDVLPPLVAPLSVWSAACANGQEAYSLAIVLEEQGVDGQVLASDLSTAALERAAAARYTIRELAGVSAKRIARHFTRDGDEYLVNRSIRDRVKIRQHNLLDPLPDEIKSCQVVFCRNVLIYFTAAHAQVFLARLADAAPGVCLFLGAAETLWQLTGRFETVRTGDVFTYRPRVTSDAPVAWRSSNEAAPARSAGVGVPPPAPKSAPRTHDRAAPRPAAVGAPADAPSAALLAQAGQNASAAGDIESAVVAFRKCAFLAPHDPIAHLHLGLALEMVGDARSALRAYSAARHALLTFDETEVDLATEGYTAADLLRLLESRQQALIS